MLSLKSILGLDSFYRAINFAFKWMRSTSVHYRLAAAEQASRARTEQAVAAPEGRSSRTSRRGLRLLLAGVMGGGAGGRAGVTSALASGAARTVLMTGRRRARNRASEETAGDGPTSLFLLGERNPIRRMTKFFIEWPYP